MKIAVTAEGADLDAPMDSRFGRCPFYVIVNTDDMSVEAIPNPHRDRQGGAGIQAGKLMAEHGVQVVLTGQCGPNAVETLEAAGIRMAIGYSGTVREAAERYKRAGGDPTPATAAPSASAGGAPPQAQFNAWQPPLGRGMCMGGGRGRGGGRGNGLGRRRRQRGCWG